MNTFDPRTALEKLSPRRHELLEHVRFDEQTRWHLRLPSTWVPGPGVEVWLLSWLPGQESPLHDHGGSSGAFTVMLGAVDETVVSQDCATARDHRWTAGGLRAFGVDHLHRVGNDGGRPAVTLHAYAPALKHMRRFVRTGQGLQELSVEFAGAHW